MAQDARPAEPARGSTAATARRGVPFWKVMVLACSAMQIGPNLALVGGFQLPYSGIGSWLAFLGAGALTMLVAVVIGRYASQHDVTASLLSYAQLSLPGWAVSVTAATVLVGYVVGPATGVLASTIYLGSVANSFGLAAGSPVVMHCLAAVGVALLIGLCASRGLDLSAKVSMALGGVCIPLAVLVTVGAGRSFGFDIAPQLHLPAGSWESLPRGIYVAMGFFIGFDCVAAIASEAERPRQAAPRALLWSVGIAAATFVAGLLLQVPVLLAHAAALDAGDSPTKVLLEAAGPSQWSVASDVVFVATAITGLIAWLNGAAIVVAGAAADGFLPRRLGLHHGDGRSLQRAVWLLTLVSVLLPSAILVVTDAAPLRATLYMSNFFVLLWLLPYGLICAAMATAAVQPAAHRAAAGLALALVLWVVVAEVGWPLDRTALRVNAVGMAVIAGASAVFFAARRRGQTMQVRTG